MLAKGLGGVTYFSEEKERELLDLKKKWGFMDPRLTEEFKDCDICGNDIFRDSWSETGVSRNAFEAPPAMGRDKTNSVPASGDSQEALIQEITNRVMQALAQQS